MTSRRAPVSILAVSLCLTAVTTVASGQATDWNQIQAPALHAFLQALP